MARAQKAAGPAWASEAAMVADFVAWAQARGWTAYQETANWDVLLVRDADGFQIGIEAKPSLNATVLCQVLSRQSHYDRGVGPDCRAVLVPGEKAVNGLALIAQHLGIVVIEGRATENWRGERSGVQFRPDLPDLSKRGAFTQYEFNAGMGGWPEMCPDARHPLPDYVPDVAGGKPAPVQLTPWKVQAIKAAIVIETVGSITRADFKALKIDPSRWTQYWLAPIGDNRWAPTERRSPPDFKAQHPVNYEQIKAQIGVWGVSVPSLTPAAGTSPSSPASGDDPAPASS